jgi:hypothetical protein
VKIEKRNEEEGSELGAAGANASFAFHAPGASWSRHSML